MSDKHKRGKRKRGFCAVPASPVCGVCTETKDYKEICEPQWSDHTFERKLKGGSFDKQYEAHHLLCVSPVSKELVSKWSIKDSIAQTVWCINNEENMLAMPLWGHTVRYYCDITAADAKIADPLEAIKSRVRAPKFANIPQHDWDHNCKEGYTDEVTDECKQLAKDVEEAEHELKGDSLVAKLKKLSKKFKQELKTRGLRLDGTHAAWRLGKSGKDDWALPFSMASDGKVTKKGFPVRDFDEELAKWIQRIAKAIKGG